jgi:hypothetical protein
LVSYLARRVVGTGEKFVSKTFIRAINKWSTIQAYYAMFHAARALIYSQGQRGNLAILQRTSDGVTFRQIVILSKLIDKRYVAGVSFLIVSNELCI